MITKNLTRKEKLTILRKVVDDETFNHIVKSGNLDEYIELNLTNLLLFMEDET